jgi:hypothetical protein
MRPTPDEAADYYFTYINQVPGDDICAVLETQLAEVVAMLQSIPADKIDYRYADGKWSIREVLSHLNDTERLFAFRAFWFARGFESPLPSFDQHVAAAHAAAAVRPWISLVEEFRALRQSTLQLFRHLPAEAWDRRGIASDNPFSVRALAFLGAGHVIHHLTIVRERYLG